MGRIKQVKGKYYDTGTRNKTFLQVAKDLKQVGIKRYYFMLEIKDPSLVDVDPYSPNITQDQVSRILTECARNIWYYLREVCRIPSQGGVGVPYIANRGNIAQTWCFIHGVDSWLCLPRQQGKTQSCLACIAWSYSFGTNDSNFIFINKDGSNAKENLQRLKDQIDCLPEYMRFDQVFEEDETTGKLKVTKAVKNATSMRHPITKNRIIIKSKATSYESALSLARGLTAPILHFDEPEFTNHIKTIVENSVSTFDTAARNAKANGALYGRFFTCTPGDLDTECGEESQKLLSDTAKWTEKLYDMNDDEVLKYVQSNGKNNILYIEYQYYQIGLTNEWLRKMYNMIGNPLVVKREILLQRLRGSSQSPFDQEDIEYIVDQIRPIIDELYLCEHFRFDIYRKLNRRTPYLIGVDCATGTNGDNNAITILDPYLVEPVAEFKCPYIGETDFENLLKELILQHLPKGVLCIERNSIGDGIVDHLMHSPIRMNLYTDKGADLVEINMKSNDTVESMLKKRGEIKKYTGVYTGNKSREDMMSILIRHMAEFKDKFVTNNITEDISRLVQTRSGKIEAASGYHDDCVMSYLMCLYVYYHGNNLARYGIIKGSQEIKDQNRGLTYQDIDHQGLIPQEDIEVIKRQAAFRKENDFESIYRDALVKAQTESMMLAKKGLVHSRVLDNTPDEVIEEACDRSGRIDLSLFNTLNGF